MKLLVLFLLLISPALVHSQIVNMENARIHTDTTGLAGGLGGNFALVSNVRQLWSADVDLHLQYKTPKDLYLILGNYGLVKSAGDNLVDFGFFHFRYNRKMGRMLRWEAFTQIQYNKVTKIENRYLLGTGPRLKLKDAKKWHVYTGSLIMYEYEKESGNDVRQNNWRNSSYVSVSWYPGSNTELVTSLFYQPLLSRWADFRIMHEAMLKVKMNKHFSIRLRWNYLFDTYPVSGIPRKGLIYTTGLNYDFRK